MDVQSECSGGRGQEGGISRPSLSVVLGRCVQACSRGRVSGHVGSSYQTKQVRRAQRSPSTGHDPRAPTPDTGQSPEPCRPQRGAGGEGRKQVLVPWRRPGSEGTPGSRSLLASPPHRPVGSESHGLQNPKQALPSPQSQSCRRPGGISSSPTIYLGGPGGAAGSGQHSQAARLAPPPCWEPPEPTARPLVPSSPRLAMGVPSLPPPFRRSHMNEPWRLMRR